MGGEAKYRSCAYAILLAGKFGMKYKCAWMNEAIQRVGAFNAIPLFLSEIASVD